MSDITCSLVKLNSVYRNFWWYKISIFRMSWASVSLSLVLRGKTKPNLFLTNDSMCYNGLLSAKDGFRWCKYPKILPCERSKWGQVLGACGIRAYMEPSPVILWLLSSAVCFTLATTAMCSFFMQVFIMLPSNSLVLSSSCTLYLSNGTPDLWIKVYYC